MLTWWLDVQARALYQACLNPYSNGMLTWDKTRVSEKVIAGGVLILILMECSLGRGSSCQHYPVGFVRLNPYSNGMLTWFKEAPLTEEGYKGLNPYSNGMLTWPKLAT